VEAAEVVEAAEAAEVEEDLAVVRRAIVLPDRVGADPE